MLQQASWGSGTPSRDAPIDNLDSRLDAATSVRFSTTARESDSEAHPQEQTSLLEDPQDQDLRKTEEEFFFETDKKNLENSCHLFSDDGTLEEEKDIAIVVGVIICNIGRNYVLVRSDDVFVDVGNVGSVATEIREHEHGSAELVAHDVHAVGMMNDDNVIDAAGSLPRRLSLQELLQFLLQLSVGVGVELGFGVLVVAQGSKEGDEDHVRLSPVAHTESCAWSATIRHVGGEEIRSDPVLRTMLLVQTSGIHGKLRCIRRPDLSRWKRLLRDHPVVKLWRQIVHENSQLRPGSITSQAWSSCCWICDYWTKPPRLGPGRVRKLLVLNCRRRRISFRKHRAIPFGRTWPKLAQFVRLGSPSRDLQGLINVCGAKSSSLLQLGVCCCSVRAQGLREHEGARESEDGKQADDDKNIAPPARLPTSQLQRWRFHVFTSSFLRIVSGNWELRAAATSRTAAGLLLKKPSSSSSGEEGRGFFPHDCSSLHHLLCPTCEFICHHVNFWFFSCQLQELEIHSSVLRGSCCCNFFCCFLRRLDPAPVHVARWPIMALHKIHLEAFSKAHRRHVIRPTTLLQTALVLARDW